MRDLRSLWIGIALAAMAGVSADLFAQATPGSSKPSQPAAQQQSASQAKKPVAPAKGTAAAKVASNSGKPSPPAAQQSSPTTQKQPAAPAKATAQAPKAPAHKSPAKAAPKPAPKKEAVAKKPPVPKKTEKPSQAGELGKAAPAEGEVKVARRDPFESLIGRQAEPLKNLPPGKAGLIVGSLRLDGLVRAPSGMIAVVSNPQQRTYFLREGDQLYDGRVDKITMDGVSFHEVGKDAFGKPLERQVDKRIYASPGEQQ